MSVAPRDAKIKMGDVPDPHSGEASREPGGTTLLEVQPTVVAAYTSEGCVRMGDASENGVWVGNTGTVTRDKFVICTGERGWSESRPLPHQVHHRFHVCYTAT